MSAKRIGDGDSPHYQRKELLRSGPLRNAGGIYRSASGAAGARGGIGLTSTEDAVVAAVRMGYRIAQTQVDRIDRLSEQLRHAGERAVGPDPEVQALDATDRLITKALLTGLGWVEGVAAEPGSPIARYIGAQFKIICSLLGLHMPVDGCDATPKPPPPPPSPSPPASPRADRPRPVTVIHAGKVRRLVQSPQLHLDAPGVEGEFELLFHGPDPGAGSAFSAVLKLTAGQPASLAVKTRVDSAAGTWKAAVCDEGGTQVGSLAIDL